MADSEMSPATNRLQWKFIGDAWITAAIYEAVELRLADRLSIGPQNVASLALSLEVVEDALYRLLRALSSVGIFVETRERCFEMTPLASCLRLEGPDTHAMALMFGGEHRRSWARFSDTLRTGRDGFSLAHGMNLFQYLEQHGEAQARIHRSMVDHATLNHSGVVSAYDFSYCSRVVDVGGGDGGLLARLLSLYPELQGTLLDRPGIAEAARQRSTAFGLSDRMTVETGDFFEKVPSKGDVYILSAVLHDWDDNSSVRILRNVARAMNGCGTLLIAEMIVPEGNDTSFAKLLDLNMMVMCPGGRERTRAEIERLLTASGFRIDRIVSTRTLVSVVISTPL